jgi:hypothetical protein
VVRRPGHSEAWPRERSSRQLSRSGRRPWWPPLPSSGRGVPCWLGWNPWGVTSRRRPWRLLPPSLSRRPLGPASLQRSNRGDTDEAPIPGCPRAPPASGPPDRRARRPLPPQDRQARTRSEALPRSSRRSGYRPIPGRSQPPMTPRRARRCRPCPRAWTRRSHRRPIPQPLFPSWTRQRRTLQRLARRRRWPPSSTGSPGREPPSG